MSRCLYDRRDARIPNPFTIEVMLASIAALAIVGQVPKSIDVIPSADAWVYGHSSNPGSVEVLRVWGTGSDALEQTVPPSGECSYAYLNFPIEPLDVESVKVTEAKLIVYIQKTEGMTAEHITEFPLEARGLDLTFNEKEFRVDSLKKGPDAAVFGKSGKPEAVGADKYKLVIDLLAKDSPFGEWFQRGMGKKLMGIALTSTAPSADGGNYYRIFSKESEKNVQPRLVVKYGPGR